MPSLIQSQESFTDVFPTSSERRSPKPQLRTERLQHIRLEAAAERSENEELLKMIYKHINRAKKIMVVTGAGISCNAGIPDFRSSKGLYNMVKKQYPDVTIRSGQEMFDISLFREERMISVFATFMDSLHSSTILAKPTKTHEFIAHLKNRGKLLRCYTQNIDGLEEHLGLELSKKVDPSMSFNSQWKNFDVVQLHGDLNSLSCTQCFNSFGWSRSWKRALKSGELPSCPRCHEFNEKRTSKGKRSRTSVGMLRPNIVLYGENHPSCEFIAQGLNLDVAKGKPDLLIIMGTSLKVDGVKKLVRNISRQVHERSGIVIFVNSTNIADCNWHGIIDYHIQSDCDLWVADLKQHIPDFFLSQQQVDKSRQLKREASELRKKQREEKERQSNLELENLHTPQTPPSTPSPNRWQQQSSNNKKNPEELKAVVVLPHEGNDVISQKEDLDSSNCTSKVYMKLVKDDKQYRLLNELSEEQLVNQCNIKKERPLKRIRLSNLNQKKDSCCSLPENDRPVAEKAAWIP